MLATVKELSIPMHLDKGSPIEEPLAERLRSRQEDAADELVFLYADRLLRAATLMLGDMGLAEDAVQETLLSAVTHIGQFRGEASLYSWLYAILIRQCRKQQRRRQKAENSSALMPPSRFADIADANASTEAAWERAQEAQRVRRAVENLPPSYREVIVMFYYEEFTIAQISHATSKPIGAIKSLLHRGRQKLTKALGGEEL